jgi:hypothetical protein
LHFAAVQMRDWQMQNAEATPTRKKVLLFMLLLQWRKKSCRCHRNMPVSKEGLR